MGETGSAARMGESVGNGLGSARVGVEDTRRSCAAPIGTAVDVAVAAAGGLGEGVLVGVAVEGGVGDNVEIGLGGAAAVEVGRAVTTVSARGRASRAGPAAAGNGVGEIGGVGKIGVERMAVGVGRTVVRVGVGGIGVAVGEEVAVAAGSGAVREGVGLGRRRGDAVGESVGDGAPATDVGVSSRATMTRGPQPSSAVARARSAITE